MAIFTTFQITATAILQIALLGLCGYVLTKKGHVSSELLKGISWLSIELFFPCFIFVKLVEEFNFQMYAHWWIFPILCFLMMIVGFAVGRIALLLNPRLKEFKREFISLITFQNAGYLPLILVELLLPPGRREQMFVYIFLFILGFNLVIWSFGAYYLARRKEERMEIALLFNASVLATLVAMVVIALGWAPRIPALLMKPAAMFGNCALPLAIFVVGGNLAEISTNVRTTLRSTSWVVVTKLIIFPLLFLGMVIVLRLPYEIGFLLVLQAAVPSATSLSVIMRTYDKKDNIISLGIFWTHIIGLLTLPVFLILYEFLASR